MESNKTVVAGAIAIVSLGCLFAGETVGKIGSGTGCGTLSRPPSVSVVYEGGLPKIRVNGTNHNPWIMLKMRVKPQIDAHVEVSKLGFRFHEIGFGHGDVEDALGVYSFRVLDERAGNVMRYTPDDFIFINFELSLPKWSVANKGECVGYLKGRPGSKKTGGEFGARPLRPSPASLPYRREVSNMFAKLREHLKKCAWADKVVGVRVSWGVYNEWHGYGQKEGPDVSPAMVAAFKRWDGGRWKDEEVPTIAERRKKGLMLDPVRDAKALAYFECLNHETRSLLLHMLREAKKTFPGRLAGAYYGYPFTYFLPEGQNAILEGVIDSPDLDFCSVPASYLAGVRAPGGTYHHRGVTDAFRRRGKILFLEDDMRFHHVKEYAGRQYFTKDGHESHVVMLRNMLSTAVDGCGIQLVDPFGGWETRTNTFNHPSILSAIAKARDVLSGVSLPADSGNTLAVVVSPRERLRWANAIAYMLSRDISSNVPHYVYTSGASADIVTLEDFLRSGKVWKNVIFPDAYTLGKGEVAKLEKRLAGSKSVWFVREPPVQGSNHIKVPKIPCGNNKSGDPKDQIDMSEASRGWHEIVKSMGEHIYTGPGECMRKYGDYILISTGKAGKHALNLPGAATGVEELVAGRMYAGRKVEFETDGPATLFFRIVRK